MSNSVITVIINGASRTADIHIPSQHTPNGAPTPVIFCFHGGGGTGNAFATSKWAHMQDKGYILVFPDAIQHGEKNRWIIPGDDYPGFPAYDTSEDIDFVDALVAKVNVDYNAGKKHATGFSSGGKLTWGLYAHRSAVFEGIAPVSRHRPPQIPAPATARPSFFGWGRLDSNGGNSTSTFLESYTWLLDQHGLDPDDSMSQSTSPSCSGKVVRRSYTPSVEKCRFHMQKKGGHAFEQCNKYSAASEIVDFFNDHL